MGILQNFVRKYKLSSIRQYRIVQCAYNLINYKKLSYLAPLYKEYGLKRSRFRPVCNNDLKHLPEVPLLLDAKNSETELINHPTFLAQPEEYKSALKNWSKNGYVHLKGFYDLKDSGRMAEITESLWANDSGAWRFGDRRVQSAFENPEVWEFINHKRTRDIISMLLGHETILLNSIHFLRGDEQPIHSDSFYMTTYPIGRLIGAWIALEDISKDAGPLRYYPGSHKLAYVLNDSIDNLGNLWKIGNNGEEGYFEKIEDVIASNNLEVKYHLAKKGDLFLWHANLLHGGSKIHNKDLTRKSMVGHFIANDVVCYHENTQRPAHRNSYA